MAAKTLAARLAALEAGRVEFAADRAGVTPADLPWPELEAAIVAGLRDGSIVPLAGRLHVGGPGAGSAEVIAQFNAALDAGAPVLAPLTREECEAAAGLLDAGEIVIHRSARDPQLRWSDWYLLPPTPVQSGITAHPHYGLCELLRRTLNVYEGLAVDPVYVDTPAALAALLRSWVAEGVQDAC